jgi:DNA polymerase-3 subunit epsilon
MAEHLLEELQRMAKILNAHPDFKVAERQVDKQSYGKPPEGVKVHRGLYIDTETSGKSSVTNKIIELSMIQFTFDMNGNIYDITKQYNGFEDPGEPLSAIITELTGLTDADVAGQSLDDQAVYDLMNDSIIVIAHRAAFDRPFMDNRFPDLPQIRWACSMEDINWSEEKVPSKALGSLSEQYGYFFDAHRAESDVRAGIELLTKKGRDGTTFFSQIRDAVVAKTYRIWTHNSPFAVKDALSNRDYSWHPGSQGMPKAWNKSVSTKEELLAELEFLNENISKLTISQFSVEEVTSFIRYSDKQYGDRIRASDVYSNLLEELDPSEDNGPRP